MAWLSKDLNNKNKTKQTDAMFKTMIHDEYKNKGVVRICIQVHLHNIYVMRSGKTCHMSQKGETAKKRKLAS